MTLSSRRHAFSLFLMVLSVLSWAAAAQIDEPEWIPLCGKCLSPSISSSSGIGTARSVAEGKVTSKDAKAWCDNWQPDDKDCVKQQLEGEKGAVYRISADCTKGKLTSWDDKSYTLAGVWTDNDIGHGRARFRDAKGQVVPRDEASGGLSLAAQWEVLCTAKSKTKQMASAGGKPQTAGAKTASAVHNAALPPSACGGQPLCSEVTSFAATLNDFRVSTSGRYRVVTANINFFNKTDRPLVLGYVSRSGVVTDDRGNRYEANDNSVRGIGLITSRVDTKFVLQPGERSDARIEYAWEPGRTIFGLSYEMELTVREIDLLAGNQVRLGKEHALRFSGLSDGMRGRGPVAGASPAAPGTVAASPTAAPADAQDFCGTTPHCYSAGPFTAQVTNMTDSVVGNKRDHVMRLNIRFKNVTNQPIVLGYVATTSLLIDNQGTRFYWGTAGTHDTSAQGIGIVEGTRADPQFVLRPGESRNAVFQLLRDRGAARTPLGSLYGYNVSIAQIEVLPGNQLRTVREISLDFQNLTAGGAAPSLDGINDATQKLRDLFKKKQ
ncbi:MAG: hypothetical protein JST79_21350 [Acidobacteria bacterium]|nr:hypothetical protein [Acidobacteriota bacterium]